MKKGQIQLDKWHFKLGIIPIYWKDHEYMLHFGIFKLLNFHFAKAKYFTG